MALAGWKEKLGSTISGTGASIVRVNSNFNTTLNLVGAAVVMVLLVVVCSHVFIRAFFGGGLEAAWELSKTLLVVTVCFGLAYVQKQKAHISIKMFTSRMSQRSQNVLQLLASFLGLALFATLSWLSWAWAWNSWVIQEFMEGVVGFPIYPSKSIFAIGITAAAVQYVIDVIAGAATVARRQ